MEYWNVGIIVILSKKKSIKDNIWIITYYSSNSKAIGCTSHKLKVF